MSWLKIVWTELLGLFVDDGSLAAAVLVWLGVCAIALPRLPLPGFAAGGVLFAGLALVLAENVLRRAGRR